MAGRRSFLWHVCNHVLSTEFIRDGPQSWRHPGSDEFVAGIVCIDKVRGGLTVAFSVRLAGFGSFNWGSEGSVDDPTSEVLWCRLDSLLGMVHGLLWTSSGHTVDNLMRPVAEPTRADLEAAIARGASEVSPASARPRLEGIRTLSPFVMPYPKDGPTAARAALRWHELQRPIIPLPIDRIESDVSIDSVVVQRLFNVPLQLAVDLATPINCMDDIKIVVSGQQVFLGGDPTKVDATVKSWERFLTLRSMAS